ncbi:MAG: hypothetical protein AVDCRST_MAG03-3574 [uncultured Rubrobacteraceae bacterium]|uniref:Uncharacterized protein n=1 Tax=uncultured Rubrobacteraceae bacterium TaxID=349277 RepID=A0A6J4QEQ3_9ACTN|nr:MAG: hypothetical protein AVDCRST_MAG03-3574 [uncultured Rubrobacteraceae bacterium]
MRRRPFGGLWAALPAAMLATVIALLSLSSPASTQETCPPPHATGNIIVGMDPGASAESLERMKRLNSEGGEENLFQNAWVVEVLAGSDVAGAIALYSVLPGVAYAEPNQIATPDELCVGVGPELSVDFADGPDPVAVGEKLTYAIAVVNSGHAPAPRTAFTTGVPEDSRLVSSGFVNGETEGDCPLETNGIMRCDLGPLASGGSAVLEFVVRPTRPGNLSTIVEPATTGDEVVFERTINTTVTVPEHCTVADTGFHSVLLGTPGRDVICGFDGEDVISAGGGDDVVYGGVGGDTILAGPGSDRLLGGEGDDTLRARDGTRRDVDHLRGGPGTENIAADPWDRVRRD